MDFSHSELEVSRVESSDIMDYEENFYGSLIEKFDSHSSVNLSNNYNSRKNHLKNLSRQIK